MKHIEKLNEAEIKEAVMDFLTSKGLVTNLSQIKLIVKGKRCVAECECEQSTLEK